MNKKLEYQGSICKLADQANFILTISGGHSNCVSCQYNQIALLSCIPAMLFLRVCFVNTVITKFWFNKKYSEYLSVNKSKAAYE